MAGKSQDHQPGECAVGDRVRRFFSTLPETVLEEAARVTSRDRHDVYGHPADDYARTAAMWGAYLGHPVTAEQAMVCMILVKVSRLAYTPGHRDSLVDIAGYARCIEMLGDRDG